MKRRLLRIIVLFWIGWYISGPVAETFDYWDGPRQEVHDILSNAGGKLTLLACAFCLIVFQARKLRERYALSRKSVPSGIVAPVTLTVGCTRRLLPASIHSPPTPLRI